MDFPSFSSGCLKIFWELVGVYRSKPIFSEIAILPHVYNFLKGINIYVKIKDLPDMLIRKRDFYRYVLAMAMTRKYLQFFKGFAEHVL